MPRRPAPGAGNRLDHLFPNDYCWAMSRASNGKRKGTGSTAANRRRSATVKAALPAKRTSSHATDARAGARKAVGRRKAPTSSAAAGIADASVPASVISLHERLNVLVEGLGNNRVAALLEVSRSQPSRWRREQEGIDLENQRKVLDLDYVMSRLLQLYPQKQAEIWLESHNSHLGARPIDILRLRGAGSVVEAIDAEAEGAYA